MPRFDVVMALIGGSLTGPLVFVLPHLMYSKIVALKAKSMRPLTPEVYSGSERRRNGGGMSADPRIHSRSIYYGVLSIPKTEYHRYSYVYYDELGEDLDEIAEYDAAVGNGELTDEFSMTRRANDNGPIFVDASRPFRAYRGIANQEQSVLNAKLCSCEKWNYWIGYLIVLFGILITISSTYINIKNTIRYVQFAPSCIANFSVVLNSA